MTTTTLSPEFIAAFAADDDPRYCVGNSHALIEHYYSATSARCVCGSTLVLLTDSRWMHRSAGRLSVLCPPYECGCGQRH